MALKLLSSMQVDKAKGAAKEYTLNDGEGLLLRVRPDGSKSWLYRYTSPVTSARRKKYYGSYPAIGLADARELAAGSRKMVANGIDPLEHERQQAQEQEQAALLKSFGEAPRTVAELCARWRQDYLSLHHADEGKQAAGVLERHALPVIGDIALENLRAPHIAAALQQIKATGKLRTTGMVLSNLRQMFAHATELGWMPGDPSAGLRKRKYGGPAVKRDRVLLESEIVTLMRNMPKAGVPPAIECGYWIMLSCATRVEETSLAQYKHINFKNNTWLIPKENQKKVHGGNEDHLINLSPFAMRWIKRLIQLQHEREERRAKKEQRLPDYFLEVDYLFPARRKEGSLDKKAFTHAADDRQQPGKAPKLGRTPRIDALMLPGGKWTPHDLRRTASTLMQALHVDTVVINKCQNHKESDTITATYQHAELRDLMHEAWLKLGAKLEELARQASVPERAEPEEEDI